MKNTENIEVMLSSTDAVKNFVSIANKSGLDIDLSAGRYVVDANSIMGIFSLDLSKPVKLKIHPDKEHSNNDVDNFIKNISKYIVSENG